MQVHSLNRFGGPWSSGPQDHPWSNYGRLLRGETDPLVDPVFFRLFWCRSGHPKDKYRLFVEEAMYKPEVITERQLYDALLGATRPESRHLSQNETHNFVCCTRVPLTDPLSSIWPSLLYNPSGRDPGSWGAGYEKGHWVISVLNRFPDSREGLAGFGQKIGRCDPGAKDTLSSRGKSRLFRASGPSRPCAKHHEF